MGKAAGAPRRARHATASLFLRDAIPLALFVLGRRAASAVLILIRRL
jgi:hypothetical protein